MKICIVSDLHLVARGATLKGLDPAARLRLVFDDLREKHADAALCVLLGDLAQDGRAEGYGVLRDLLARLPMPVRAVLGNHDDRANFRAAFPDHPADPDGFVQSVVDTPRLRLVFLDSHAPGRPEGVLCDRRLAWLDARLAEAAGRRVLIFLHHPPFRTGLPSDAIGLREPGRLRDALRRHGQVEHLFAGHTHRLCGGVWQGIPFTNVGPAHYAVGVHLAGAPGPVPRRAGPVWAAIAVVSEDQVVVHAHDAANTAPLLAADLFPPHPWEG